ncbi:MAG: ABC transporter permease [Humibacillus sp.]|nr:ABC transporter permease [Humibacillus sp.]MDN5776518.1 ABC transporter permease [Humibacillus sp.]
MSINPSWPRYVWPQVALSQRVYWQDIAFALVGAVMPIAMGIFPMVQVRDARPLPGGIRPIDLLAPSGLCVSIIWIAYAVINSAARRRETRTYKRLRATPIPQSAILVGEATSAALPALAQSGIVLAIAVGYFEVAPPVHWSLVVTGLVIGAITMGLLTFGVSGLLPSSELSTWIVTPFVIGMWILSGSLTVTSGAASTIDRISDYLPSTAFVQIVRTGYIGQDFVNHDLASHPQLSLSQAVDAIHQPLGVLILWIAVGYLLFRTFFTWEPRSSRRRGRVNSGTRGKRTATGSGE